MSVTMAERIHASWSRTPRSNPSLGSADSAPGSISSRSSIGYSVRNPPPALKRPAQLRHEFARSPRECSARPGWPRLTQRRWTRLFRLRE